MQSVGVRGSIDSGGYAAPATVKARTGLADGVIRLQFAVLKPVYSPSFAIPCGREQSLLSAIKEHPTDNDVRQELGQFYLQHGEPNRAMAYLEPALRKLPTHPEIGGLYATAAIQARKFNEAISVLKALPELAKAARLQQLLGVAFEEEGLLETAEREFHAAALCRRTPENVFVWGTTLLLLGRNERALEVFRGTADSGSALLSIGQAIGLYNLGKPDEALALLLRIAERHPTMQEPYGFIADVLHSGGSMNLSSAVGQLRRLSQRAPHSGWANYVYAVAVFAASPGTPNPQQTAEVEDALNRAIREDPGIAGAHYQLAALFALRSMAKLGIEEYVRAIQADPNLAEAHYRLAQLYFRSGQHRLAEEALARYRSLRNLQNNTTQEQRTVSQINLRSLDRCQ